MTFYRMIDNEHCETFEVASETPRKYLDARGNGIWKKKLTGVERRNQNKQYMPEDQFRETVKRQIDRNKLCQFLLVWMEQASVEDLRKIAGMLGYKEERMGA